MAKISPKLKVTADAPRTLTEFWKIYEADKRARNDLFRRIIGLLEDIAARQDMCQVELLKVYGRLEILELWRDTLRIRCDHNQKANQKLCADLLHTNMRVAALEGKGADE